MKISKEATETCFYCPNLCRYACPVADADQKETSTPRAKMATMKMLVEKKIPWTRENALNAYNCSSCGQATEACELDNPVAPVLERYRRSAYKKDMAPDSVYKYCKKFKARNNPYNVRLLDKMKKKFSKKWFEPAGATYFPGCTEIYKNFESVVNTLELFEKLGVEKVGIFDQAIQCCGYPLYAAGDQDGFKEHAEVMMHLLEDYPFLVTGAPVCHFTFRELYPAHGFPLHPDLMTITEFLEPYIEQTNIHTKKNTPAEIAYHDPCYAGRYLGEYEAPRSIIKNVTGFDPVEFSQNRESSYCCGGGGLLPVTHRQTAQQMTENRLDQFEETGAKVLVTSCPTCVHRFRKSDKKVQVKGLIEFLNQSIDVREESDEQEF
jgi:Fe-S oxidoreductase